MIYLEHDGYIGSVNSDHLGGYYGRILEIPELASYEGVTIFELHYDFICAVAQLKDGLFKGDK